MHVDPIQQQNAQKRKIIFPPHETLATSKRGNRRPVARRLCFLDGRAHAPVQRQRSVGRPIFPKEGRPFLSPMEWGLQAAAGTDLEFRVLG